MKETLHIFIGFDEVETVAFHVLTQSILARATVPIAFHPIKRSLLKSIHNRERDPKQSNEFSFTRFLVPYLMGYNGVALFMDCDMMLRTDINELFESINLIDGKSVYVCKHEYEPKNTKKYLGATQYQYPRKNWSSVMLFNCAHHDCKKLTPEYVNEASGLDLHRFNWTADDRIGELDLRWNWLVGEYTHCPDAKNVHWTNFGPWLDDFANTDYSDEWFKERYFVNLAVQNKDVGFDPTDEQ